MNLKFPVFLATLLLPGISYCQTDKLQVKLSDLYIPNAPGFILADKSPSSIDKPSTPRAFGVSLLNLWQGGAVEVTPFWLTNKPTYTFEDWVKKKNTIIETFNLSVATYKTDTASNLAAGVRTQIFRIYSEASQKALMDKENEIIECLTQTNEAGEVIIDEACAKKALHQLEKLRNKGLFSFEIAGALLGASSNNTFKNLSAVKSGIWSNIRWSPLRSSLDFVGLVRFSHATTKAKSGIDSSFFDLGISFIYQVPNFDFSFEYIRRKDVSKKENYDRLAMVANYALHENMSLVISLGKNFTKVDNIISLFGIKFGLARENQKPG